MGYFSSLMIDIMEGNAVHVPAPTPAPEVEAPAKVAPPAEPVRPAPEKAAEPPKEPAVIDLSAGAKAPKDDAAKRKAHEEAEAKRKAEFDAKQAAKKQAEAEALHRLEAMSDEEATAAAKKRVAEDTELLTRRNMKDCVAHFIAARCEAHPAFARLALQPGKSMVNCFRYINRKAREFAEKEMEDTGQEPEGGVYGLDIPDSLCYRWAVAYFEDPDAPEDRKGEEKFIPKPYPGASGGAKSKAQKSAPKKAPEKSKTDPAQITLLEAM